MRNTHNLCIQIYIDLSQPNDPIKADIETIEEKFSLYNTRRGRLGNGRESVTTPTPCISKSKLYREKCCIHKRCAI